MKPKSKLPSTNYFLLSKSGFTLIEILLALSLSLFLMVLIINSFTTLIKTQRRLLSFKRLETISSQITNQIQNDIRWATDFTSDTPHQFSLTSSVGDQITYQWHPNLKILTKNTNGQTETIHPANLSITDFEYTNYRDSDEQHLPLVNILITIQPATPETSYLILEKQFTYTTKKTIYEI